MRLIRSVLAILLLTGAAVGFAAFIGCEDEPSSNSDLDTYFETHPYVSDPRNASSTRILEVDPASAQISAVGEKVLFTAKGGQSPIRWDVANTARGTVTPQKNKNQAIYTVTEIQDNSVIAYDNLGSAGIAAVSGNPKTLQIIESHVTLTSSYATTNFPAGGITAADNDIAAVDLTYQVFGGITPYSNWQIANGAFGAFLDNTVNPAVFRTADPLNVLGDTTITVTDADGNVITATLSLKLADQ